MKNLEPPKHNPGDIVVTTCLPGGTRWLGFKKISIENGRCVSSDSMENLVRLTPDVRAFVFSVIYTFNLGYVYGILYDDTILYVPCDAIS